VVITVAEETQLADAPDVWRWWAEDLTAATLPGGHFVPEESPRELAEVLTVFPDHGADHAEAWGSWLARVASLAPGSIRSRDSCGQYENYQTSGGLNGGLR
jgi:hypothetical protein